MAASCCQIAALQKNPSTVNVWETGLVTRPNPNPTLSRKHVPASRVDSTMPQDQNSVSKCRDTIPSWVWRRSAQRVFSVSLVEKAVLLPRTTCSNPAGVVGCVWLQPSVVSSLALYGRHACHTRDCHASDDDRAPFGASMHALVSDTRVSRTCSCEFNTETACEKECNIPNREDVIVIR